MIKKYNIKDISLLSLRNAGKICLSLTFIKLIMVNMTISAPNFIAIAYIIYITVRSLKLDMENTLKNG